MSGSGGETLLTRPELVIALPYPLIIIRKLAELTAIVTPTSGRHRGWVLGWYGYLQLGTVIAEISGFDD